MCRIATIYLLPMGATDDFNEDKTTTYHKIRLFVDNSDLS